MHDVRTRYLIRIGLIVAALIFLHLVCPHPLALDTLLADPSWDLPHRTRLWLAGILIALTMTGWAASQSHAAERHPFFQTVVWKCLNSSFVFAVLTMLTMIAFGWHYLPGFQMDVDEGHSILAARTLLIDPRFWISTDVGTHGPVVSLSLLILPALALKIDYASSRLVGIAMFAVALLGGVLPIYRRVVPEATARLLLLPGIFLIASLRQQGYVSYNGEHPILCLSLVSAGLAVMALLPPVSGRNAGDPSLPSARKSLVLLFVSGLLLGAVPWAKWQGVPIVAVVGGIVAAGCWFARDGLAPPAPINGGDLGREPVSSSLLNHPHLWGQGGPNRGLRFARRLSAYVAGGIVPTALVLLWVFVDHAFSLMWHSYVEWNIVYASRVGGTLFNDATPAWFAAQWLDLSPFQRVTFPGMICGAIAFAVFVVPVCIRNRQFSRVALLLAALVPVCLACWYCAVRPANAYYHYVLFFLFPTIVVSGLLWGGALQAAVPKEGEQGRAVRALAVGVLFCALSVLVPTGIWLFRDSAAGPAEAVVPFDYGMARDVVYVPLIRGCLHPGERIAVWGWRPDLFVLSDALPATRSPYCARESFRSDPMQPYFLNLYVRDLDRNSPPIFIDEVQPRSFLCSQEKNLTERVTGAEADTACADLRHEQFVPLADRIQAGYSLWFESAEGIRIYVRNDRIPEARAFASRYRSGSVRGRQR